MSSRLSLMCPPLRTRRRASARSTRAPGRAEVRRPDRAPRRAPPSVSADSLPASASRKRAAVSAARAVTPHGRARAPPPRPSRSARTSASRSDAIAATGQLEVGPHALRVDLEHCRARLRERGGGAARRRERARQRVPLCLPCASRGALVLRDERPGQDGRVGAPELCCRPAPTSPPTGFRFCGIADEPPPSPTSADLARPPSGRGAAGRGATFPTTPQADRERRAELGDRARGSYATGASARRARARGRTGRRPRCLLAERRERPRRAAELGGEPVWRGRPRGARARVEHRDEPAGRLEPERRRHRVLEHCPPRHRRVAVRARERRAGVGRAGEVAPTTRSRPRRATSIAAVSTMSWLVAPRCTYRPASSPTRSTSVRTSGSAGLPAARPPRGALSQSNASAVQASAIAAAVSPRGRCRRAAPAAASARSASSIAASQARPETASASSSGTYRACERGHTAKNVVCAAPANGCRTGGRRRPATATSRLALRRRQARRGPDRPRSPRPRPGSRGG